VPPHRPLLAPRRAALLVAVLLLAAGCGSSPGGRPGGTGDGQGTDQKVAEGFSVFVASYDIATGPPRRFLAGLLDAQNQPISYGSVTMRFAYLGTKAQATASAEPTVTAQGSYLAIPGSKAAPAGDAKPRPTPPSQARGVYAAQVGFDKAGFWGVEVRADLDGTGLRSGTSVFEVKAKHAVPDVGDKALPSDNLTLKSKGVPASAIDSRAQGSPVPDKALHEHTIAGSLAGHRPIVAVFSTPVYCQSQFCGPITDMIADLAGKYGAKADFVHVEVWKDFRKQQLNDAARQWLYRGGDGNEPWVFVIGADGKITARFDNVATAGELEPLLAKLPG
jgi:hypothetical protein